MLTISLYILLSATIGLLIYRRQNRLVNGKARLGGEISPSKALWLYWTISVWFFLLQKHVVVAIIFVVRRLQKLLE